MQFEYSKKVAISSVAARRASPSPFASFEFIRNMLDGFISKV